jgi:D-aminopeptidase
MQPSPGINTGLTVILPRREWLTEACHANIFRFNGAGEVTGSHWVQETGLLNSPIVLTNSMSVGDAYRGVLDWAMAHHGKEGQLDSVLLPVVAETYDGYLNDICKMMIKPQDVTRGIDLCNDGPVPEGNTGGGTGMVCHHWKGGTGSASRVLPGQPPAPAQTPAPTPTRPDPEADAEGDVVVDGEGGDDDEDNDNDEDEEPEDAVPGQATPTQAAPAQATPIQPLPTYTVGVLVQANYGKAEHFRIGGAPVGRILRDQNAHERIILQKAEDARREAEEIRLRNERRQKQYEEQLAAQSGQLPNQPDIDLAFAQANQLANQLQQANMQQQAALHQQSRQSSASDDARAQAQLRWQASVAAHKQRKDGSIIVVLATDAPLNATQCERLAKRATVGFARVGGVGHHMSGDIFIAFSTGNSIPVAPTVGPDGGPAVDPIRPRTRTIAAVDDATLDGLFEAAADATEEAIYNAMFMAQSMEGFKGRKVEALPLKWIKDIMEKYL